MSSEDFKLELRRVLLDLPSSTISDNQVVVRCPFCGDSVKDYSHAHFSIKIDLSNDDMPVLYHCFRCRVGGILSAETLRNLDIHNLNTSSELTRYNKITSKLMMKKLGYNFEKMKYSVPEIGETISKRELIKLKYISERLGIRLVKNDVIKYKIVLSLRNFLKYNEIDELTVYPNQAKMIEQDYVGFLSTKNNYIIFRDITGKNKYRYIKYMIHNSKINQDTFYTIPQNIDMLSNDKVNIHVTEGVFDIIGVYNNVLSERTDRDLFLAVTSGDYLSPIMYILKLGVIGNVDIHIYSDAEVPISYYKRVLLTRFDKWVEHIYVYYNELSKDCGVPKEQISLNRIKLK